MATNNSWNSTVASAAVTFNSGLSIATTGIATNTVQPAFSVVSASAQTSATGDGTVVTAVYGTTTFDQGSNWNGTSLFTAPVTGRYLFTGYIRLTGLAAAHTAALLSIVTTSATYNIYPGTVGLMRDASAYYTVQFSQICSMTATDTAYITISVSNGTKVVGLASGDTRLMGFLIC